MPTHSQPRCMADSTAPRMTALRPGASPHPVEIAIFTLSQGLLDQPQHLARLGVASQSLLGEDPAPVHIHLEYASGGLDEFDLGVRVYLPNLGRQTGGPRLATSKDAALHRHLHRVPAQRA